MPNDKVGITRQRMLECVMNNSKAIVSAQAFDRLRRLALEFDRGGREANGFHSHVRRFKLQARIFFCSRSSVSNQPPLGRARGTIMRTTVDHALMRGLVTAGPVMRRGASSV
jgi:hypothetical protein